MIKITHRIEMLDGKESSNYLIISTPDANSELWDEEETTITLTLHEAHELHTALGEKLKEIEANQ